VPDHPEASRTYFRSRAGKSYLWSAVACSPLQAKSCHFPCGFKGPVQLAKANSTKRHKGAIQPQQTLDHRRSGAAYTHAGHQDTQDTPAPRRQSLLVNSWSCCKLFNLPLALCSLVHDNAEMAYLAANGLPVSSDSSIGSKSYVKFGAAALETVSRSTHKL